MKSYLNVVLTLAVLLAAPVGSARADLLPGTPTNPRVLSLDVTIYEGGGGFYSLNGGPVQPMHARPKLGHFNEPIFRLPVPVEEGSLGLVEPDGSLSDVIRFSGPFNRDGRTLQFFSGLFAYSCG
jgi:hypothetical protein